MIQQIELRTRDESRLAEEATERGVAGLASDLSDQLTVICALANLGGEVSYDVELTESYFAQIESAGKRAAQITGQLLVRETGARATVQRASDTTDPRQTASSFRRRLTSARALVTKAGAPRPPL
jgi:hypothetical protein